MAIRTYISVITLHVNVHKLAEWIQDPHICYLQEIHFFQGHIQIESERIEENILCKRESKESWSSNALIRQNRH